MLTVFMQTGGRGLISVTFLISKRWVVGQSVGSTTDLAALTPNLSRPPSEVVLRTLLAHVVKPKSCPAR